MNRQGSGRSGVVVSGRIVYHIGLSRVGMGVIDIHKDKKDTRR